MPRPKNNSLPANKPAKRAAPGSRKGAATAERRDATFGQPTPLWELIAWWYTTGEHSGNICKVSDEWSLVVNDGDAALQLDPTGKTGLSCGAGEAIAFRVAGQFGHVASLRIRRNRVWALSDGGALEEELSAALRAGLHERAEQQRTPHRRGRPLAAPPPAEPSKDKPADQAKGK